MPRSTAVAKPAAADLAVDTRLEEAVLTTSLKKLVKSEQSRTQSLREYAEAIVALRLKLTEATGLPLAQVPRSAPYREAVGRVYAKAGLDEKAVPDGTSRAALGASIRYHVAEVCREKGIAAEAGISEESPTQRLTGARKALAAQRGSGPSLEDVFGSTLAFMCGVEEAPDAGLLAMLDQLEAEIARLRGLAPKRRSRRRAS